MVNRFRAGWFVAALVVALIVVAAQNVSRAQTVGQAIGKKGAAPGPAPSAPADSTPPATQAHAPRSPQQAPPTPQPLAPARREAPPPVVVSPASPQPASPSPIQVTSPLPLPDPLQAPTSLSAGIEGTYSTDNDSRPLKVRHIMGDFYDISAGGWEGVGILEGAVFKGVFRQRGQLGARRMGELRVDWTDVASPKGLAIYREPKEEQVPLRWRRLGDLSWNAGSTSLVKGPPPRGDGRPAYGEYVFVEELPEAITRVQPIYPDRARESGVDGTVMIQVLVVEDGTVADARITKSIPPLDDAAVAAVRQWRFRPAMAKGQPVAVWVAVPMKFSLH